MAKFVVVANRIANVLSLYFVLSTLLLFVVIIMMRATRGLQAEIMKHMNGLTYASYSPEINEQLDYYLLENGYQSYFWVNENELDTLRAQYESKLKENIQPHIIFDPTPSPTYRRVYNSDQFEYPCFSEVWRFAQPTNTNADAEKRQPPELEAEDEKNLMNL